MQKLSLLALTLSIIPLFAAAQSSDELSSKVSIVWQQLEQPFSSLDEREALIAELSSATTQLLEKYPQDPLSIRLRLGDTIGTFSLDKLRADELENSLLIAKENWDECRERPSSSCLLNTAINIAILEPKARLELRTHQVQMIAARLAERGRASDLDELFDALPSLLKAEEKAIFQAALLLANDDTAGANELMEKYDTSWLLDSPSYIPSLALFQVQNRRSGLLGLLMSDPSQDLLVEQAYLSGDPVGFSLTLAALALEDNDTSLGLFFVNMAAELPTQQWALESGSRLIFVDEIAEVSDDKTLLPLYKKIIDVGKLENASENEITGAAIALMIIGEVEESLAAMSFPERTLVPYIVGRSFPAATKKLGYQAAKSLSWPISLDGVDLMSASITLFEMGLFDDSLLAFEEAIARQQHLRSLASDAALLLSDHFFATGDQTVAVEILEKIIAANINYEELLAKILLGNPIAITPAQSSNILQRLLAAKETNYSVDWITIALLQQGYGKEGFQKMETTRSIGVVISTLLAAETHYFNTGN